MSIGKSLIAQKEFPVPFPGNFAKKLSLSGALLVVWRVQNGGNTLPGKGLVNRRAFLKAIGSAALLPILPRRLSASTNFRRRRPSDATWPSQSAWKRLDEAVGGNLIPVDFPLSLLKTNLESAKASLGEPRSTIPTDLRRRRCLRRAIKVKRQSDNPRATQVDCVKSCGGGGVLPRSPRLTTTGAGNGETEAPPKRPRI